MVNEKMIWRTLIRLFAMAQITLLASSCGYLPEPQTQSLPVNLSLEVSDPLFRRVTNATELFEVKASGVFTAGAVTIRRVPVKIDEDTKFQLIFTLPISDPAHINFAVASGKLTTSRPVVVGGVAIPQEIILAKGQATGRVDLLQSIGVFLFNVILNQIVDPLGGGDVRQVIKSVTVERAVLNLRPDASFDVGRFHINTAPHSKIEFSNLVFDQSSNYEGQCLMDLRLARDCIYNGVRTDFAFNGGHALFSLNAKRANRTLTLTSDSSQKPFDLNDCLYRFGKKKQCSAHAERMLLHVTKLNWQKTENTDGPIFQFLASMIIERSQLTIKNQKNDFALVAHFTQQIPADLEIDRDEQSSKHYWSTNKVNTADSLDIEIKRPSTTISLASGKTAIGPVSLSKEGDFQFTFSQGTTALRKITWGNNKKKMTLSCSGSSTLSIPKGMSMDIIRDEAGMRTSLPLSVKLATATIGGPAGNLKLNSMNGKVLINVDRGADLSGDLDFAIAESALLGKSDVLVKVHGIELSTQNGQSLVHFKQCSLTIPDETLRSAINDQLPSEKTFPLEKMVLKRQRWRYKEVAINAVTVNKLTISKMSALAANKEHFVADAHVTVNGTVEKSGLLAVLKKSSHWKECPWSASGLVTGTGQVQYTFVPNNTLSDSELRYETALKLAAPRDVDLDWSKVSGGLIEAAESSVITGLIKKIKPVPINYAGNLKLFAANNSQAKSLRITNLKTKPATGGVELDFAAELNI